MEIFYQTASEAHKKQERAKARALRKSPWWGQMLAKGECSYCGEMFSKEDLTMDHKIPVSRGGRSTKGNIVVSCKECNTKKKHLTPAEIALEQLKP